MADEMSNRSLSRDELAERAVRRMAAAKGRA
jgi:hypothetical protein